jgi:hypothetical protein
MQDAHPGPSMQQQAAEKILPACLCKVEMYWLSVLSWRRGAVIPV